MRTPSRGVLVGIVASALLVGLVALAHSSAGWHAVVACCLGVGQILGKGCRGRIGGDGPSWSPSNRGTTWPHSG